MIQFPICLAITMSINTIASLKTKQCPFAVCIWNIHVFPMGNYIYNTYVEISRVAKPSNLFALARDTRRLTKNIVHRIDTEFNQI